MNCESCGNELIGGAIICRLCNHNNALRGDWRTSRPGQQTAPRGSGASRPNQSRASGPLTELPKIVPRKDSDANLLRFPPTPNKPIEAPSPAPARQTGAGIDTSTAAYPPWREELKERVRQIKEKRTTGELIAPPSPVSPIGKVGVKETRMDRNPIIESALNRIRWSSHTPALTTTIGAGSQGARAAAVARLTRSVNETQARRTVEPERRRSREIEQQDDAVVEDQMVIPVPPSIRPTVTPSPVTRSDLKRVETKTLAPKINRDTGAKLETKPAPPPPPPVSKILAPRAPRQLAAEKSPEPVSKQRVTEPLSQPKTRANEPLPQPATRFKPSEREPLTGRRMTGALEKPVETQVIEIAQAPEPLPPPEAEPASLWARAMAAACDFEIIMASYLPIFGSYAVLNESFKAESTFINQSYLLMVILLSAISFVYQLVMLGFAGRTFGMAMINLTLVNTYDENVPVTNLQKILRAFASTIVFICFPLHLLTRFTPFRRSLPDLISGTTVTRQ